MSFTCYLIRKFDFTHENLFFREFSDSLNSIYKDITGEHVLIGNISCNGHQLDAIYITRGQFSVIDFKDYHGELTFSENNPWKIKNLNGELLFVQGGAQMRNPFQQVRAYRFSLMDYLSQHKNSILNGTRTDIRWDHVGCIVLFQNKVTFIDEEIPNNIKRYFHIADKDSINNLLDSIHSQGLELTDNEINSVISVLDIKPENLLSNYNFDPNDPIRNDAGAERLSLIKKLLNLSVTDSLYKRIINYYKTLINAERFKESEIIQTYFYNRNPELIHTDYNLNLTDSQEFHRYFLKNYEEKFPKNLFIALNISINGITYPILHTIILSADIRNKDEIKLNFNEFDLYNKILESMGLSEDMIDELKTSINKVSTLDEKLICIREILEVNAELTNTMSVGLSSESLFSAQLISELNALYKLNENIISNTVFDSFIKNKIIPTNDQVLDLDPLVQISTLNPSQQKAVKLAFNQPLTIITGPPGTGKSQVVLNIIANAVTNCHSVLFASKNNKAIDSVKDRMEEILQEPYLLRMGSRDEINNNLKPQLTNFISRKNNGFYPDNAEELTVSLNRIREQNTRLEFLNSQIHRIPQLEKEITKSELLYTEKLNALYQWLDKLGIDFTKLFFENNNSVKVDVIETALMIKKTDNWENGYFSKLFFKWFHKSRFENSIKSINKEQSPDIYEYVQLNSPWADPDKDLLVSAKINLKFLIDLKSKSEKLLYEKKNIQQIEDSIKKFKKEYDELVLLRESNETEIKEIESILPQLGKEALNQSVQQKLFNLNPLNTQLYNDYLPVKIWRDEDKRDFRNCLNIFTSDFKAICLTNLSVKNSFLLDEDIFDLLVIDEASQCDIASALPLIFRSRNVVIIGDPLQLKHITKVQDYEEKYLQEGLDLVKNQLNYVKKSLFDFSFDLANKSSLESVFLDEHYRCHPQIIGFSNTYFYERRLGQSMKIRTIDDDFHYGDIGVKWINIMGEMHESKNLNIAEVNRCVDLTISLASRFPNASIGIITPFVDQYKAISERLPDDLRKRTKPDTVHKYQGDEKDIIIFTTVVSNNSAKSKANFINKNDYLLNVAITRAKSSLYIIGNFNYCNNLRNHNIRTPLSNLANYVNSSGRVIFN